MHRLTRFTSWQKSWRSCAVVLINPVVYRNTISFYSETSTALVASSLELDEENSGKASRNKRSEHLLSLFLRRTEDTSRVLDLLNSKPWNEDMPIAVNALNAKITVFVVCEIIKFCADLDTTLEFFNWWKNLDGNSADSYVYGALMNRLGKAGRMDEMEAIASQCEGEGKVSVGTFTVQLSCYKSSGHFDGAIRTWKRMVEFGIEPNLLSYTTLIDMFASKKLFDEAADLYLLFMWEGYFPNVRTLTVMIYHLADNGKLDAASMMFESLPKVKVTPNALTFTALMRGYAKAGDMDRVLDLARRFKDAGNRPHQDVFHGFFRYLVEHQREDDVERLMLELWPELPSEEIKTSMLKYKGKSECFNNLDVNVISPVEEGIVDDEDGEMTLSNCTSVWNYVGLVRCMTPWTHATALALQNANVKWDGHLVAEIMKRIRRSDVGFEFFVWVERQTGFAHDKYTYTRMIQLLLSDGKFDCVKQLLVEARSKHLELSLHTYNNILKFCGLKCQADIALEVFDLLQEAGLKPDRASYHNLIHTLHRCGRYWRVATMSAEMKKAGFALDATIYSFLVSGFAESGKIKYAKAYYRRMRACGFEPSEHIYRGFIIGYHKTGRASKAKRVFRQMKKDDIVPSIQLYDLMIGILRKNRNIVALRKVRAEKNVLQSSQAAERKHTFDRYLKFHQIFVESFAERTENI